MSKTNKMARTIRTKLEDAVSFIVLGYFASYAAFMLYEYVSTTSVKDILLTMLVSTAGLTLCAFMIFTLALFICYLKFRTSGFKQYLLLVRDFLVCYTARRMYKKSREDGDFSSLLGDVALILTIPAILCVSAKVQRLFV